MRIGIQTWGSEGDVRPFVALAHALAKRGHQVEMVYTEIGDRRYEAVAAALGFTARAVASPVVSPGRAIEIGLKLLGTRNQLQQGLLISRELLEPTIQPTFAAAVDLCRPLGPPGAPLPPALRARGRGSRTRAGDHAAIRAHADPVAHDPSRRHPEARRMGQSWPDGSWRGLRST